MDRQAGKLIKMAHDMRIDAYQNFSAPNKAKQAALRFDFHPDVQPIIH
jgi:hypothetical protein